MNENTNQFCKCIAQKVIPLCALPCLVTYDYSPVETKSIVLPFLQKPIPMKIPTLFNTGENVDLLKPDPHWFLTGSPDSRDHPGSNAFAYQRLTDPEWIVKPGWITNRLNATGDGIASTLQGRYTFQTSFDLSGFDLTTVSILRLHNADDSVANVRLNGVVSTENPMVSGYRNGTNTICYTVNNRASTGGVGLRVIFDGTAIPLST